MIQTISFELAKNLDGKISISSDFKKSTFMWVIWEEIQKEPTLMFREDARTILECGKDIKILYPAYTLDQILKILPFKIIKKQNNQSEKEWYLCFEKSESNYIIGYYEGLDDANIEDSLEIRSIHNEKSTNLTEAAGKLLLWCLKNGYLKCD